MQHHKSFFRTNTIGYRVLFLLLRPAPKLRLEGGSRYFGRVVIDIDGTEGTVCDDKWTPADAEVVCRQMNFDSGKTYK